MQITPWLWVIIVIGVLALGVGLGQLLYYLFWKIEQYYSVKQEAETAALETTEEGEEVPLGLLDETTETLSFVGGNAVRFARTLTTTFQHPFAGINTIICWQNALFVGEKVKDPEDNTMAFHVEIPKEAAVKKQYFLIDKSKQHRINVFILPESLQKETQS
jgi:hypothetical protein